MEAKRHQEQGDKLINEAIKRILQDIVIRGHGDRLIGRWSREPELQQFLEQVPYMLDRINQLHSACTRVEEPPTKHRHHHHHHHHESERQSSPINDFINLIGDSRHWMVRVRDPLGLTPLHKAVLHNNRPIVEYILDRYSDELAPAPISSNHHRTHQHQHQRARLVDAQDKYGRSALHYAAALASSQEQSSQQIYQFLLAKGASLALRDFRGKTPAYYVRHPNQLRAKSIIHLANKLNANYQASILTKTLRATSSRAPISGLNPNDASEAGEFNRESMSVSCVDLRNGTLAIKAPERSRSSDRVDLPFDLSPEQQSGAKQTTKETQDDSESLRLESIVESLCSDESINGTRPEFCRPEQALRWLMQERCPGNPVLSQRVKQHIRKCLTGGVVDKVFEMVAEGYGSFVLQEAGNSCWNQQCKRYINNVVPSLLRQVDALHESIAANQVGAFKTLLSEEPTLARIRRPYKRANQSALHIAVQLDRRRIVKHLVTNFPELITQRDSNEATCLHWAAKSLKCERLYCWLTEHYGSQLEQLADSKGKSAAEYRCQALRLSTFGESRPGKREQDSNVVLLLKQTQQASDKLQLSGRKLPLTSRTLQVKRAPKLNQKSKVENVASPQSPEVPLDQSIEISIEEESEAESEPGASEDLKTARQSRRSSVLDQVQGDLGGARRQSFAATREETSNLDSESNQNLLGEMVQLDSSEMAVGESPGFSVDVPNEPSEDIKATQQKPASPMSASSSSASSTRRLEPLITNCIKNNDFTKLEHLILAGRGQQVLEVCANQYESGNLSAKMRRFLDETVPDLMESILKIHNLLHQFYAEDSNQVNKKTHHLNFNKLCAATEKSEELIMGRDAFGATLLHVAVMRSHKQLIGYLLRRCANAAGAPDNQKRTAMHYAAIALAAYKHHGNLKLTNLQDLQAFNLPPSGFWLLGDHTEQIYEELCTNHGDLCEVQDKLGSTDSDYLRQALAQEHVDLALLRTNGLLDPQALVKCCPDFAQLLTRYNYFIVHDAPRASATLTANSLEPDEPRKSNSVRKKSSSSSGPQVKTMRRTGSCGANSGAMGSASNRKTGASSSRSRTADELLRQLSTSDMMVPAPPAASLESSMVTIQVAPKPTVGSSMGFHQHHVPSPTNAQDTPVSPVRAGSSCGRHTPVSRQSQRSCASSSGGANKRKHSHHRPLLDDLDPNHPDRHHHHHHHHRIHHVYRNGSSSCHHHGNRSKQASPSVVGGVIVPSIIHNDNRDEIETYDIIYRQPPAAKTPVPGESERSSSSSCSSGDEEEVDEGARRSRAGARSKISSESNSDSELSEDDDRVLRLSNEFEERVRKEKSDLKAKVDQIMNEIKLSAKSDKSSRFLSSPNNIAGEDGAKNLEGGVQTQAPKAGKSVQESQPADQGRCKPGNSLGSSSSRASCASSAGTSACCSSSGSRTSQTSSTSSASSSKGSLKTGSRRNVQLKVTEDVPALGNCQLEASPKNQAKKQTAPDLTSLLGDVQRAQPFSKNTFAQTYLHFIASRPQNPSTLYKVIEHGSYLIGERDAYYRTARDIALQFGHNLNVRIIDKFVIEQFIDCNTKLLWHLLYRGYSPLIHVSDADGNDIMMILKLLDRDRMVQFLLQMADFQRWRDELHTFIRHGYSAGASELIRKHRDLIRAFSVHGRTSLHLAVIFDRMEMIDELLEVEPSCVNAPDNMSRTALHYTYGLSGLQDMEAVRDKLIAKGADLNLRDAKMRTPKYYYIFKKEIEDIKKFELELN